MSTCGSYTFDEKTLPERQNKSAELFLGRMQPIHIGHKKIINSMNSPFVAIVKGLKSSADKSKNPLDINEQRRLLQKISTTKIIEVNTGYIPEIIRQIRGSGFEISTIYAGADRIAGYKRQIISINKKVNNNYQIDVEFKETERLTSATNVRNAIRTGDEETFKRLMPEELHNEFERLLSLLSDDATVTSNIAASDKPLVSKKIKDKGEYVADIVKRNKKPKET